MLALHLSDIHFRHPQCGGIDPERVYRAELAQHAAEQVARLGPVSAIFVTGDIAYRGLPEEYEAASAWFDEIAVKVGCRPDDIYVVPGNHDVDRTAFSDRQVRLTVEAVAQATTENGRERALMDTLHDPESAKNLFASIEAYNAFAAQYDCNVHSRRPYWERYFPLTEGAALYVRGLTSTFISGIAGTDDRRSLYLSALQTGIEPLDGVINLAMLHHPLDWFSDMDSAEPRLLGRPGVVLCGHKHAQWLQGHNGGALFVRAGSVNPERDGLLWAPAYNFIEFNVEEQDNRRDVRVRTWQYDYQAQGEAFRLRTHRLDGLVQDYFDHRVTLRGEWRPKGKIGHAIEVNADAPADCASINDIEESVMAAPQTRQINRRFWRLAHSERRSIMVGLGKWPPDTPVENEYAVFRAAIVALAKEQKLGALDEAIQIAEQEE